MDAAVLLYDGDCGFCSRSVLFVFRRDPRGRIRFASLQSDVARRMLTERGIPLDASTVVLLDDRGAHVRSTAILRAARLMRWPWSWAYAAIVMPRPLRDALYRLVAKHRHRFGLAAAPRGADASSAVEACRMPSPELRARMLDK